MTIFSFSSQKHLKLELECFFELQQLIFSSIVCKERRWSSRPIFIKFSRAFVRSQTACRLLTFSDSLTTPTTAVHQLTLNWISEIVLLASQISIYNPQSDINVTNKSIVCHSRNFHCQNSNTGARKMKNISIHHALICAREKFCVCTYHAKANLI